MRPPRDHAAYWAFLVHRVSGIALALFLPAHFLALATVLKGEAALDGFLHWTDAPLVKAAEIVLVLLLAAHLMGGIRLLLIEFFPWREALNTLISVGAGVSLAIALMFALGAL